MTDLEYAVRVERGGGSATGDVVAVFTTLEEAREYLDTPDSPWAWLRAGDLHPRALLGGVTDDRA